MQGTHAPVRYAVRQVVDQEMQKAAILRDNIVRQARFRAGNPAAEEDFVFGNHENTKIKVPELPALPVKKDFFGRVIKSDPKPIQQIDGVGSKKSEQEEPSDKGEQKIWVTFHEGLNNAVRKPISLDELLRSL